MSRWRSFYSVGGWCLDGGEQYWFAVGHEVREHAGHLEREWQDLCDAQMELSKKQAAFVEKLEREAIVDD